MTTLLLFSITLSVVRAIAVADPGYSAQAPRAGEPAREPLWRALPPTSLFEHVYYNWFKVTPTLLFAIICREDLPEHVRDMVLRRGQRDPTLDCDSVDEDFYAAMVRVTGP